jgi:hypothetical protein
MYIFYSSIQNQQSNLSLSFIPTFYNFLSLGPPSSAISYTIGLEIGTNPALWSASPAFGSYVAFYFSKNFPLYFRQKLTISKVII